MRVENAAASSESPLASSSQEEAHTMERVRDFVEKIVEGLIGNVDETPIDRLYDHPEYKPTTDPPTMAHTALRDIVERAVEEARKLPGLASSDETERTQEGRNITEHSYEDLLATAILNKVIEKFQREQVDGNSNVLHETPTSRTKCILNENELGLDEGVEEGCSSLEPLSQDDCSSDCSASCLRHLRNQPERLSLTIEERIEEVTTTYTSDEEHRDNDVLTIRNTHRVPFPELGMDIIDPSQESSEDSQDEVDSPTAHVDLISPIESWEENWLFQKKRVQVQADPVAMLVPNSSADFKALIGDKDAEDTSDLSECSSAQSDEEIEKELQEAINNVVPRSPKKHDFSPGSTFDNNIETLDTLEPMKIDVVSDNHVQSPVVVSDKQCAERRIEGSEKIDMETPSKTNTKMENTQSCTNDDPKKYQMMLQKNDTDNKVLQNDTNSLSNSLCANTKDKTKESKLKSDNFEAKSESCSQAIANDTECTRMKLKEQKSNEIPLNSVIITNVDPQKTDKEFDTLFEKIVMTDKNVVLNNIKNEPIIEPVKEEASLERNSSKSENPIELSSISLSDENIVSNAPKTPACTPTRTSLTESNLESVDDAESFISNDENVLNSLECAKKKLMVVDDSSIESFKDEETKGTMHHKLDFHAEDAQQESEYTEHYDIATQRHLDSLTKVETFSKENEVPNEEFQRHETQKSSLPQREENKCREAVAFAKAESASYSSLLTKKSEEEVQLATPPRPGTIAEREHKKWENAPPIENNPYSEESIQKRLWERQYARRLSDIPGIHAELPKSNGTDLEVILTPHEPDIKRFSRDYYINNSKVASGEKGRRSATSISSRPSSSLSQGSSSTGAEQDQQEETQYKETDSLLNRSNDVKSKVAKWQRNNVETNYQVSIRRSVSANEAIQGYNTERTEDKYLKKNDVLACRKVWDEQRVEDILENERKNNKNEINAKLNNQENNYGDGSVLETKKSYVDENEKKIRRIDLKAYGFENEFSSNGKKTIKTSSQRVVNKLDLKSFGYDGGLRRTQSNNHLDSTVADSDFKPRIITVTNKSNLSRHSDYHKPNELIDTQGSGDNDLTQSTETLNTLRRESYSLLDSLKPAKSVPNVAKCEYYTVADTNDREDEEIEGYNIPDSNDEDNKLDISKSGNLSKSYDTEKSNVKNGDVSSDDLENDTDIFYEKEQAYRPTEKLVAHNHEKGEGLNQQTLNVKKLDAKRLPLPSVRRLAEAFSKQPEITAAPISRTTKSNVVSKERSSTPEIHIVETPRQMHSLTARSLSKKFREGLRQIPNKVTSPPASHVTMEQARVSENQPEIVQSKGENSLNDTNVISPGKLKSNIIFWEQMQKKH